MLRPGTARPTVALQCLAFLTVAALLLPTGPGYAPPGHATLRRVRETGALEEAYAQLARSLETGARRASASPMMAVMGAEAYLSRHGFRSGLLSPALVSSVVDRPAYAAQLPADAEAGAREEAYQRHVRGMVEAHVEGPAAPPPAGMLASKSRSFRELVRLRMAMDRRPIMALVTDKASAYLVGAALGEARGLTVRECRDTRACAEEGARADLLVPRPLYAGDCDGLARHLAAGWPSGSGFAFKARHLSGCNVLVNGDGRVVAQKRCLRGEPDLAGSEVSAGLMVAMCRSWTSQLYSIAEWGYSQLEPGVLLEGLWRGGGATAAAGAPRDIKCFSFGGVTRYVAVVDDRFAGTGKTDTFYDRSLRLAEGVSYAHSRSSGRAADGRTAALLRGALRICDALTEGLDFMRVDLLDTDAGLVLGELTPYPGGGSHRWQPPAFDGVLGGFWKDALET